MDRFPYLTRLLGWATLAVFALAIAGGLLFLAWAAVSLVFSPFVLGVLAVGAAIAGVIWVFDKLFDAWDALPGWVRWILRVLNPLILIFEAVRWAVSKAGELLGITPGASATDESARALAASKALAAPVQAEPSPGLGMAARNAASGGTQGGAARNVIVNVRTEKFDHQQFERVFASAAGG